MGDGGHGTMNSKLGGCRRWEMGEGEGEDAKMQMQVTHDGEKRLK
jgi:hypothetical protein